MARTLRERLGIRSVEERAAEEDIWADVDRQLDAEFARQEWIDEKVEREDTRDTAKQRFGGILRYKSAYDEVFAAHPGGQTATEHTTANWLDERDYWSRFDPEKAELSFVDKRQRYLDEMHDDLADNFLYELFVAQFNDELAHELKEEGKKVVLISQSFPTFSLVVALRAAITALATRANGCELLEIEPELVIRTDLSGVESATPSYPIRDTAKSFYDLWQSGKFENLDAEAFVMECLYAVPGIYEPAGRLLAAYSRAVRVERQKLVGDHLRGLDTPLPDEPGYDHEDSERHALERTSRMSRAIAAYTAGGKTARQVAKEYRITYTDFLSALRARGVTRRQGRPNGR